MRWKRELAEHGQALLAWSNKYEFEKIAEAYKQGDEAGDAAELAHEANYNRRFTRAKLAMRWVAKNLGKLWD